jgi:uncharacterized membrane protein
MSWEKRRVRIMRWNLQVTTWILLIFGIGAVIEAIWYKLPLISVIGGLIVIGQALMTFAYIDEQGKKK